MADSLSRIAPVVPVAEPFTPIKNFTNWFTSRPASNCLFKYSKILSRVGSWSKSLTSFQFFFMSHDGVLYACLPSKEVDSLGQFFSPQLLFIYMCLVRPCMEYASHTSLLDTVKAKSLRLINCSTVLLLTILLSSFSSAMLYRSQLQFLYRRSYIFFHR